MQNNNTTDTEFVVEDHLVDDADIVMVHRC